MKKNNSKKMIESIENEFKKLESDLDTSNELESHINKHINIVITNIKKMNDILDENLELFYKITKSLI